MKRLKRYQPVAISMIYLSMIKELIEGTDQTLTSKVNELIARKLKDITENESGAGRP